ncbi:MAG TPA: NTP transferase domain-containing protein [Puia sp.]|nr:NTP transferase domain-containing protein [Puia sp.]
MINTGIIILAAGNSSRLGRPKQLLPYRGKTLLSHVVTESLAASLQPVIVVTGAFHNQVLDSLTGLEAVPVQNPHWETGMASGIAVGLRKALDLAPNVQSVIVSVCDQPHITADLFRMLTETHAITGKGMIASAYAGTSGTPVLFGRRYFEELAALSGNAGAKQLLARYAEDVASVPFPKGSIDIDTEEDYGSITSPPVTGDARNDILPNPETKPEPGTLQPEAPKTEAPKPEIPQPKPLTEQPIPATAMEVHHHPDLHHNKKPWKEYLLEGLMIFIAVMMGFIAENIREEITNSQHAHELTSQLVADLRADTARLNEVIEAQTKILQANDSLITLLQQPLATADLNRIQQLIIISHNLWAFHPAGGAIAAIKNELHLKQFAHSQLITHIAHYEGYIDLLHTVQDIYLQYQHNMLDSFLREHFTPANLLAAFGHRPLPDAHMRNLTQAGLTQLAADMVLIRVVSDEIVRDDNWVKENAVNLLKYTISEYDLAKD